MPEKDDLIHFAIRMANKIASHRASTIANLDAEDLAGFLIEQYIHKTKPKIDKANKHDKKFNAKAYITKSLNGYSLNYIRDHSHLSIVSRRYKDLYMMERALLKRLPLATDSQIALECGTTIEALQAMRAAMANSHAVPLDCFESEPLLCDIQYGTEEPEEQSIIDIVRMLIYNATEEQKAELSAYFEQGDQAFCTKPIVKAVLAIVDC